MALPPRFIDDCRFLACTHFVPTARALVILSFCPERSASAAHCPSSMTRSKKSQPKRVPGARRKAPRATKAAREFEELNRVGIALSETRDVEQLLDLILKKAREITAADAGSLYLVEKGGVSAEDGLRVPLLRFKLTQNDSVQFPFSEHTLPVTEDSMAGYCALHGEVIELADAYRTPKGRPFRFNATFDKQAGYRTRSQVTLPMKNGKGEVLGVLQLINCKRNAKARLTASDAVRRWVCPFPERAVRLGLSLASQAAVAYENSTLYRDIENLFDGFVNAAVKAIEQRDPTTSGHSQRVCEMTVTLAEAVDRFDYIRRDIEARTAEQKVEALLSLSRKKAAERLRMLDEESHRLRGELDRFAEFIAKANEPTILPSWDFEFLTEIAQKTYRDARGTERPYLLAEEVRLLSIPRGSLDADERRQIESHVVHSFNFLAQIPWTPEFRAIPEIARAHHEKVNGKGYPFGLNSGQIPVQAKMMTICDIFDALSASDRPYKRAVPTDRALDILKLCVRDEEIDPELFRVFLDARVYRLGGKSP